MVYYITMDTIAVEEAVKFTLQKYAGGNVFVKVFSAKLEFRVDSGPRLPGVGGFSGGETIGVLRKGKMFPEMLTGLDPLGIDLWVDILMPLGWFE